MATNHIPNDIELINRLTKGDEFAFQQVIKSYLHPLRYYAWTFVKNQGVAEEFAYDAFVKLWQKRESLESSMKMKRFLYLVTKNSCLDYLKATDRYRRLSLDDVILMAEADIDLEANVIQAELIKSIYEEINNLPEKQASVFRLSFIEGLSPEEISNCLGISINAVYLNKSLATKALRYVFQKKGDWMYVLFLFNIKEFL